MISMSMDCRFRLLMVLHYWVLLMQNMLVMIRSVSVGCFVLMVYRDK